MARAIRSEDEACKNCGRFVPASLAVCGSYCSNWCAEGNDPDVPTCEFCGMEEVGHPGEICLTCAAESEAEREEAARDRAADEAVNVMREDV